MTIQPATNETHTMATAMAGFDDLVEEAMAEWKVPGLVIAVVQDGEINN